MSRPEATRGRRWRRRLLWCAGIGLVLLLVVRVVGILLLPTVLEHVARGYRLKCEYERLDLALLRGDAELWNLRLAPEEGGTPYVVAEYCGLDVSTLNLLRGRLVVHRLEADGLDLNLERDASGGFELFRRLSPPDAAPEAAPEKTPEPVADAAAGESKAGPTDLAPPVQVDAFRLQHVQLHYADASGAQPLALDAEVNLRVSGIAAGKAARIELMLSVLPGPLFLRTDGSLALDTSQLRGKFRVRGSLLRSPELRQVLAESGLDLAVQDWSVGADLEFEGHARGPENAQLAVQARLSDVSIEGDGQPLVGLASATVECEDLHSPRLVAAVRDGHVDLERSAEGLLRVAGLELRGTATEEEPAAPPEEEPAAPPSSLVVQQLTVEGVEIRFEDHSPATPARLAASLELATVKDLCLPLTEQAQTCHFDLRLLVPGVMEKLALAGTLQQTSKGTELAADCTGTGITARELSSYLRAAGLESLLDDATLHLGLQALLESGPRISATIAPLDFSGSAPYLQLKEARLVGLTPGGAEQPLSVEGVEVDGLSLPIRRQEDGSLELLGLHTVPAPPLPPTAPAKAPERAAAASTPAPALPALRCEHVALHDLRLHCQLDGAPEPVEVQCQLEGKHLALGSAADPGVPGTLHAVLHADGVLDRLALEGLVRSGPGRVDVELNTTAEGLRGALLGPLVAGTGLELTLKDGTLRFTAQARVQEEAGGLVLGGGVKDLELTNPGQPSLTLSSVAVDGLTSGPEGLAIASISIQGPQLAVTRDAEGTLEGPGFRWHPAVASAAPAVPPAAPPPPVPRAPEAEPAATPPRSFEISSLSWTGCELQWSDGAVNPAVATRADLSASAHDIALNRTSRAAPFALRLEVQDVLDALSLEGTLTSRPEGVDLMASVSAEGLRAGPLAAYFPAGMEPTFEQAALGFQVHASRQAQAEGGQALRLHVSELNLKDGATEWLHFQELVAAADRLDPAAGVFRVQEVALRGVRAEVHRTASDLTALGIRKSTKPAVEPEPAQEPAASEEAAPVTEVAAAPRTPITEAALGTLELGIERFTLTSTVEGAEPLILEQLQLRNQAPIHVGTEFDDTPVEVELTAALLPVLDRFHLGLHVKPFSVQPEFSARLEATGLHGAGITQVLPELAARIDPSTLVDGKVSAAAEGFLSLRRRGPLDYSLADGFGGELTVEKVLVEDVSNGMAWAGLNSLLVEARSIHPSSGNCSLKSIVLERPLFHGWLDADGLHALGIVWKTAPPEAPPEAAGSEALAAAERPAPQEEAPQDGEVEADGHETVADRDTKGTAEEVAAATTATTGPVFRVDTFEVHGIDFWVEDRNTEPALHLPIEDLYLSVKGFTTAALTESPLHIQFLALGGPLTPLTDEGKAATPTDLRFFDDIAFNGQLVPGTPLQGWARSRIRQLFLPGLRGPAQSAGVTVGDGLLDSTVNLRLKADGTVTIDSDFRFTDLQLSEPADGPISSVLRLPAPLDQVLFALRDPSGAINIPLNLEMKEGSISVGTVTATAITTLGTLLGEAVAQAPLRVLSSVGSMVPLGGKKEVASVEVVELPFAAGSILPSTRVAEQIRQLRLRLQDDPGLRVKLRHELGEEDLELERRRMNPDPEELSELRSYFQQRIGSLNESRAGLAVETRAAFEAGTEEEADEAQRRMQEVERRIGVAERDLDYVLGLEARDSQRQKDRRTRSAVLDISQGRIAEVLHELNPSGDVRMSERLQPASPRATASARPGTGCIVVELQYR